MYARPGPGAGKAEGRREEEEDHQCSLKAGGSGPRGKGKARRFGREQGRGDRAGDSVGNSERQRKQQQDPVSKLPFPPLSIHCARRALPTSPRHRARVPGCLCPSVPSVGQGATPFTES